MGCKSRGGRVSYYWEMGKLSVLTASKVLLIFFYNPHYNGDKRGRVKSNDALETTIRRRESSNEIPIGFRYEDTPKGILQVYTDSMRSSNNFMKTGRIT